MLERMSNAVTKRLSVLSQVSPASSTGAGATTMTPPETPLLAVRLDEHPTAAGIVQVRIEVPPADHEREVEARANGRRCTVAIPGGAASVLVGVQTHLLDNGTSNVLFELEPGMRSDLQLEVDNLGDLAGAVRDSLERAGAPFVFAGLPDSTLFPYTDDTVTPWFDRPDALKVIEERLAVGEIELEDAELLRGFVENGYIELEDLLDDELIDAVNAEIDAAVREGYQGYTYGSSQRIEHLHADNAAIRRLWLDRRYLRVLDLLFGETAMPVQTLTYVFGSQQGVHQDAIHLTPFPAGYMCGTWIALEDVRPGSGELAIYPGTHRYPRVYLSDVGCSKITQPEQWATEFADTVQKRWYEMAEGHEPVVYRPKRGTVLIWHENLMHEGSARQDLELSRRSIVIHSFARGAVVYYDSSGSTARPVDPDVARAAL